MLMAVAVVILLLCASLMMVAGRRPLSTANRPSAPEVSTPLAQEGAFQLLFRDKYLMLIAGMVIFLNWVNSSGEYLLDRALLVAASAAHGTDPHVFVGTFKADYFAWYNLLGLTLQLFGVSRILKLVGVRKALLVLPGFALVAYGSAMFVPVLAVLRWVKIGENSIQYSLQDTTRNALFLMTSRVEKFVGKTAVDTVAVRVGAIMSALTVYVGSRAGWSIARLPPSTSASAAPGWPSSWSSVKSTRDAARKARPRWRQNRERGPIRPKPWPEERSVLRLGPHSYRLPDAGARNRRGIAANGGQSLRVRARRAR